MGNHYRGHTCGAVSELAIVQMNSEIGYIKAIGEGTIWEGLSPLINVNRSGAHPCMEVGHAIHYAKQKNSTWDQD